MVCVGVCRYCSCVNVFVRVLFCFVLSRWSGHWRGAVLCFTLVLLLWGLLGLAGMLEREAKREKNLEKRAIELARRARATEAESKTAEKAASGKDEKMEEILRRVDGEFLSLIKVRAGLEAVF